MFTNWNEEVDTLVEFNASVVTNGPFDITSWDATKCCCVVIAAVQETQEFRYELTDCDTSKYRRICWRAEHDCSWGRRKRQVDESEAEGTLDTVFLESKKIEREKKAKEAQEAYAHNFKKMNLEKSYSSLFEIMW